MVDLSLNFWARFDLNSSNSPEINPVNNNLAPPIQITFVKFGENGDLVLETDGDPLTDDIDPDTKVVIGGVEYEFVYEFSASFLPGSGDLTGKTLSLITVIGYPEAGETTRLFFTPEYPIEHPTDPTTDADLIALGNGTRRIGPQNTDPVCFLAGTLIETSKGMRAVETLDVGDEVAVKDGGFARVIWISSSLHDWSDDAVAESKPISFRTGALGEGVPTADLIVSPQHHLLIGGAVVSRLFGVEDVLAPAKGLTGMPGVRMMQGKRSAEYYHVMLEHHAIINAQGADTESFYPGPTAVRMLRPGQRASLYAAVPALKTDPENGYGPTARKKITRREAERLVAAMLAERGAKAVAAE